ncbi:long-chain-fatty-acid--CoA ligase [Caproiciproducens sp.]
MVVPEILYRNARKYPNKAAIVYNEHTWTFAELDRLSNKVANGLISVGIQKGDQVSMMMTNSEKFIAVYFGILKAGAVVVQINSKLMKPEVAYIVDNSDSKILFYSDDFCETLKGIEELAPKIQKTVVVGSMRQEYAVTYDELIQNASEEPPRVDINENDRCCILFTSGTTGKPTGAVFTHRAANYNAITAGVINHRFNFSTRNLIMMPLFHSAPLNNHMLGTFWAGGTVVLLDQFDCKKFLETIEQEKITHFFGPSVVYLTCVKKYDISKYDLSSVEFFIMGGSPCSPADQEMIIRDMKLDGRFMQVYGLTEAGPFGTALFPEDIHRKAGSIGLNGSIGAELVIVDKDYNKIEKPDVVGELAVSAESHMLEYYKNPEKTARTLINGWIMTGDLAKYDTDGYIYFMDRSKDMIISGGQNVYSKEVEDAIMLYPGVSEVAVIGIPHKEWGESVKAVVSTLPETAVAPEDIKQFVSDKLAKFKRPRYVEIVSELPHNPAGKIMKPEIRKLFGAPVDSPAQPEQ